VETDQESISIKHETVPIELLEYSEDNVNEETDDEFSGVVRNIKEYGFIDPVWCYKREDKYRIINGNHRTKAAVFLGYKELPVAVFDITDDNIAEVVAIRANYARGKLNASKFTKKYNELRRKYGDETLRAMMGISDEKKWKNLYRDVRATLPPAVQRALDKTKHEITDVEDLARVIKNAIAKYGHNLERSFIFFEFSGRTHLTIKATDRAFENIRRVTDYCEANNIDINDYVNALLEHDDGVMKILEDKKHA
jgi:ParB/RepB/Spo0J family partition protein